jgi:hypothetical protein
VALPLAGSQLVVYGFYNFCLGVALALFVVGLVLRTRSGWRPGPAVGLAALLLLTWSAHLLPWLVAVGATVAFALARSLDDVRAGERVRSVAGRHLLAPLLATLPSVGLTAAYAVTHASSRGAVVGGFSWARIAELLSLASPLLVHSAWELVPVVLVAVVLTGLVVAAVLRRGDRQEDGGRIDGRRLLADRRVLGGLAVLAAVAFLVTPSRVGADYGFLPQRLAWFPLLLAALFCATGAVRSRRTQLIAASAVVLAASALVVIRLPTQLREAQLTDEVLAVADEIPPGTTFALLRYSTDDPGWAPTPTGPDPLQHVSSRLAVRAGAVDVGLYEAVYPYFQVRFTAEGNLRTAMDPTLFGLERVPPQVALSRVRGRLDYIVLVGLDPAAVSPSDGTDRVLRELQDHYRLVSGARPDADVSVWAGRPDR